MKRTADKYIFPSIDHQYTLQFEDEFGCVFTRTLLRRTHIKFLLLPVPL